MNNILFLDIDGVLNSELWYKKIRESKVKFDNHLDGDLNPTSIKMINDLCDNLNMKVVISSTWRLNRTVEQLQEILGRNGATFEIIGKTPNLNMSYARGLEIHSWIQENSEKLFNCHYYDFYNYAIIDDEADMLLYQVSNFFKVDHYVGVTPNTCYKIERYLNRQKDCIEIKKEDINE